MKGFVFGIIFLVVLENAFGFLFRDGIIATTEQGNVLGSVRVNRKGGKFYSFTSIPYAKPPVGDLRFMQPQAPDLWEGVLNATFEPPSCYQRKASRSGQFITLGSEDCLYLNVFTKKLPTEDDHLKPVMVYIHGGGFIEGSSRTELHGPEYLMTEDIVLVTINYRLNILGFLSLENETLGVTGNAALKDQVMALKWINKNIKYFGGDPKIVTLFGESAGAASAEFHTLSAMSQGLFHRVICQSGSVLNPWTNGVRGNGKAFARKLGLQTDCEKKILTTLKSLPVEQLHLPFDIQVANYRQNAPVVENQTDNPFLPAEPRKLLHNGNFAKVPMMIGYNSDEGLIKHVFSGTTDDPSALDYTEYVPNDLNPNNSSELREIIAEEIRNFYESKNYRDDDKMQKEIDAFTDSYFLSGIYTTLRARLAASKSPIYFYRFSMNTSLNLVKNLNPRTAKRNGASHADDVFYLFKEHSAASVKPGSLEDLCVERMVKMWTNFAKYGDPTPKKHLDSVLTVKWPVAKKDVLNYLEIGNTLKVGTIPDQDRVEFWDKLYEKYYKH